MPDERPLPRLLTALLRPVLAARRGRRVVVAMTEPYYSDAKAVKATGDDGGLFDLLGEASA